MSLLFDQNLSFRLVGATASRFPNSRHVRDVGLARAGDAEIREFAKREELAIVTFDGDFHERGLVHGWPPKVYLVANREYSDGDDKRSLNVACQPHRGVSV